MKPLDDVTRDAILRELQEQEHALQRVIDRISTYDKVDLHDCSIAGRRVTEARMWAINAMRNTVPL